MRKKVFSKTKERTLSPVVGKHVFGNLYDVEDRYLKDVDFVKKNEGSIDIIKDGYNGFFSERDEKDIVDKIEKVLSLDEYKLADIKRNSLKITKSFSVEKMIKRYKTPIKHTILL